MQAEAQASPAEAVEAPAAAQVVSIQAQLLPAVWTDVAPFLQSALDRAAGEFTLGGVARQLCDEQAYLWMAVRGGEVLGTLVAKIIPWERYRTCEIWLMGGKDAETWLPAMNEAVTAWADAAGCLDMRCYTRDGMEKLVKGFGFKKVYTVLRKSLDGR